MTFRFLFRFSVPAVWLSLAIGPLMFRSLFAVSVPLARFSMPFCWIVVWPVPVRSCPPFVMLMFVQPAFAPPAVSVEFVFSVSFEFVPSILRVVFRPRSVPIARLLVVTVAPDWIMKFVVPDEFEVTPMFVSW